MPGGCYSRVVLTPKEENKAAMGMYLGLDKVATDLVVEVINVLPFDAFSMVLFLFSLESQLDEDLL
jgi:hypothetical protein